MRVCLLSHMTTNTSICTTHSSAVVFYDSGGACPLCTAEAKVHSLKQDNKALETKIASLTIKPE